MTKMDVMEIVIELAMMEMKVNKDLEMIEVELYMETEINDNNRDDGDHDEAGDDGGEIENKR